jgi:hypothetical protein
MKKFNSNQTCINRLPIVMLITALMIPVLACELPTEEPLWTPETPREYTAETAPVEVYILIDEAGNMVDFESPYAYGVTASLRYVLRFWDVGQRGAEGYDQATIYRVYTPIRITGIHNESEYTAEEQANIYARTSFPSTEVKLHDLVFEGGPQGHFWGTNSETGKPINGYLEWREKEWEMHAVFYEDIQQDYLVLGEEPFYNWP